MSSGFVGIGRKRPQINIKIEKLHVDKFNPRLPQSFQGKSETETIYAMYRFFDLIELAESMSQNGYFDEEPLVVVPRNLPSKFKGKGHNTLISDKELYKEYISFINDKDTEFDVIEGNRRISTIKITLSEKLRSDFKIREWPTISREIEDDVSELPAIVYPERSEVMPYMGVRHITGIKKWESFEKARYIASLIEEGNKIEDIQKQVADRANSARKMLIAYRLIEQAEGEADESRIRAKDLFSYLVLAIGQNPIKEYLGMPKKLNDINLKTPVARTKMKELVNLFSFLFGEGKEKLPVIRESRDITGKLTHVLSNHDATLFLIANRDLDEAYERSDGEEQLLIKRLKRANNVLEKILGIIHRYKDNEIIVEEIKKCDATMKQILKGVKD